MNTLTANYKKSSPHHITFSVKPQGQSKKINPKVHEEIPMDNMSDHSPPGTIRSNRFLLSNINATSASTLKTNEWETKSTKNRAWCTVRSAIITFIIILIIILAVAVAVGIVFGVLGGQLNQNGNGARTTNQQNSLTTPSNSIVTTSVIIGSQTGPACSAFTTIDDPTRNVNATVASFICDDGPLFNTSQGGAWIRFSGTGGTKMPISSVGLQRCGGYLSGWFNGSLPTASTTEVNGTICFDTLAQVCGYSYDSRAVYCSPGVYVYFLRPMTVCSARYCTE